MRTALSILVALTGATAIQVPAASSYIYRSDNGGPASFVQLGAPGYLPHAFPAPIPLAPVKALEAYDLAAVPLPYVAAKPIADEDADDDYLSAEDDDDDYLSNDHEFEKGAGSNHNEVHHNSEGEKGNKGYLSKEYLEKGESGHFAKEHEKGHYGEAKGEEGAHFDEAEEQGKHREAGGNYKGGDHGHKSHHTKGEEVTGYHKEFDKDEYKKDATFYDVAEKSGHSKKFDYDNKYEETYGSDLEKENHGDAAFIKTGYGNAGHHKKGRTDKEDGSHSAKKGEEIQYGHEKEYGEKKGRGHSKQYYYGDEEGESEE